MTDTAWALAQRASDLYARNLNKHGETDGDTTEFEAALYEIASEAVNAGVLAPAKYVLLKEVSQKDRKKVNWPLQIYRAVEATRLHDIACLPEMNLTQKQAEARVERLGRHWALRNACGAFAVILANRAREIVDESDNDPAPTFDTETGVLNIGVQRKGKWDFLKQTIVENPDASNKIIADKHKL